MRIHAGLLLLLPACVLAATGAPAYDRDAAISRSQAAIGAELASLSLRDTNGQPFALESLRGKPLVVSLIYTSCHHVCPTITRHVRDSVAIAKEALGDGSFNIVTVGFDWKVDTPERMRIYQQQFRIDDANWHFLSADGPTIDALAANLGFVFFESAKGFDHLSQTTIVDADGMIYRQVYDQEFGAQAIVEPLKQLVFDTPRSAGLVEHWVDTFKLFCTVYDPNSGRYRFDYSIFMTIVVGTLCLGGLGIFIAREWKHAR